jgi:hypothetical protein
MGLQPLFGGGVIVSQPNCEGPEKSGPGAWANLRERLHAAFTGVFECSHSNVSRPFTSATESYVACLKCGRRRAFDPKRWEAYGRFYHPKV